MGVLRRLLGHGAATHEAAPVVAPGPLEILPDGGRVQVVGESLRQDAIVSLLGPRTAGYIEQRQFVAVLVPEPDNTVDPEAISTPRSARRRHRVGANRARLVPAPRSDQLPGAPACKSMRPRPRQWICMGRLPGHLDQSRPAALSEPQRRSVTPLLRSRDGLHRCLVFHDASAGMGGDCGSRGNAGAGRNPPDERARGRVPGRAQAPAGRGPFLQGPQGCRPPLGRPGDRGDERGRLLPAARAVVSSTGPRGPLGPKPRDKRGVSGAAPPELAPGSAGRRRSR
jgi:hypothetical protein